MSELSIGDATRRFSNRVETYVRYRPDYPTEVVPLLARETGLRPGWVVADVGSGTGISAELLLRAGCVVHGVEPNQEMRLAAESILARHGTAFRSVNAPAEATTLPDASMHM